MRLILLRHGLTRANLERLYCGSSDLPLCEDGRRSLLELRSRVDYPPTDGLLKITSGMRRADESLELLFGVQPDLRLTGLREMNFGRFEMHSYEELKNDADYQRWICDETGDVSVPAGESANAFRERVFAAADEIRRDALVICHGGVIAALMNRWFPQAGRYMYQWQPEHGLGYEVDFQGAELQWRSIDRKGRMDEGKSI